MNKLIFVIAIYSFSIVNMLAQETQSPILNSNRVGFTESSRTVTKGGFLVEGGMQYSFTQQNANNYDYFNRRIMSLPRLRLSYGITDFMEILGEGNFSNFNYKSNTGYTKSNFQQTYSLGLKFNMTKQKGMLPQTAFIISERWYGNNNATSYFKTTANLAWSYNLGKHFSLAGNILYSWSEGDYDGLGLGIKLGYNFNDRFGLYSEWYIYDQFVDFSMVNVGAWYKVSPRFLLSLNVGTNKVTKYDWEHNNGSFMATIGISFLLNNPNKKAGKKKKVKRNKK